MRREAEFVCDEHADRFDCPDALLHYEPKLRSWAFSWLCTDVRAVQNLPG